MDTYKNIEIHKEFKVSNTAVGRWIEAAKRGKNNLQLKETKPGVFKIVKNQHNKSEMLRLKIGGEKNRSASNLKVTKPDKKFYDSFTQEEIVEIIRKLEKKSEIDFKFTYKNGGAKMWNNFYYEGINDGTYATPVRTINLLPKMIDLTLQRIPEGKEINVIDIGPGNSHPVRGFLEQLKQFRKINKYIAIDISEKMLEISRINIESWFADIKFDQYKIDIETEKITSTIYKNTLSSNNIVNLVLDIGSTIGNHPDRFAVLKNIQSGIGQEDIFILGNTVDKEVIKSELEFLVTAQKKDVWVAESIGFDTSLCKITTRYDQNQECKIESITLDKDYQIDIKVLNSNVSLKFYKGQEIVVWRHYMSNIKDLYSELNSCGLRMVAMNTETDYSHVMAICQAV